MEKAEIIRQIIKKGELIIFEANKKATKFGDNSSHIILPKELIGKRIRIVYEKEITE